jgi:hypothetical protein
VTARSRLGKVRVVRAQLDREPARCTGSEGLRQQARPDVRFQLPPTEPDVRLSPHPALQQPRLLPAGLRRTYPSGACIVALWQGTGPPVPLPRVAGFPNL